MRCNSGNSNFKVFYNSSRPYILTSLMTIVTFAEPILVTARSKAWVYDLSLAGIADTNHAEGMDVCLLVFVVCYISSGLCDEMITRSEESYQVFASHCM
jgi:hypothetical protein